MKYYPFQYDISFLDGEGVRPLSPITRMPAPDQAAAITDEFLGNNWKKMVRNPVGSLKRHYVGLMDNLKRNIEPTTGSLLG